MSFSIGEDADDCRATRAYYRQMYERKQKLDYIAKNPEKAGVDLEFYALLRRRFNTLKRDGKDIPRWMYPCLLESEHKKPEIKETWRFYLPSQPRPLEITGQRVKLFSFDEYRAHEFEETAWEKSLILKNPYETDDDPERVDLRERLKGYVPD